MTKSKGFTLVELLIVIVVIAILAAITLVSYNSIQKRAYNVSTVQAVRSWANVLTASYVSDGTKFVTVTATTDTICLGNDSEYPENADLNEFQCWADSYVPVDLSQVMGDIAHVSMKTRMVDGFRGIQYGWDEVVGDSVYMWYVLEGADQDCGLSGSVATSGSDYTDCVYDIGAAAGGIPIDW